MSQFTKFCFVFASFFMLAFIGIHLSVLFEIIPSSYRLTLFAMISFVLYLPLSSLFCYNLIRGHKKEKQVIDEKMQAIDVSNMVVVFNRDGVVLKANDNFCSVMGYERSEIVGKHHKLFCGKDDVEILTEKHDNFWDLLLSGKHIHSIFHRFKRDGGSVWVNASYCPIKSTKGEVYQIIKIANDVSEEYTAKIELINKNTYLEHAAKIIRHDMNSGINIYIPRGLKSLERRLEKLTNLHRKSLNIESPLKLIREGLSHTQKVYIGVREFTNLVRNDSVLETVDCDIHSALSSYLSQTAYSDQVYVCKDLPILQVNESLFCTAIDNLIRNGLKYNDSPSKVVRVFMEDDYHLVVSDNGRGMSQEEFERLSQPYQRNPNQKESGTGLGLNICVAILKEHNFKVSIGNQESGTKILIRIKNVD